MKPRIIPAGAYVVVWLALMAGFGLTLLLSRLNLHGLNVPAAVFIAFLQMMLIIVYFMHARYTPRLTWVFVMSGFYWLGILLLLGLSDYISRGWLHN